MTEQKRLERNQERLKELYPTFRSRLVKVIADMEAVGLRPRIQDGYRTPQDQLKAYNSGNSDLEYGFHNCTGANGKKESLAVDLLDDNFPLNPKKDYLLQLAYFSEKHGLITGIRWGVVTAFKQAIDNAIKEKNWKAPVKIGWDPTHIQPTGITVDEAKAGKRPV